MRPCDVARRLNVSSGGLVANRAKGAGDDGLGSLSRGELEAKCREELIENRVMWELMRDPKAGGPERLSKKRQTALGERPRKDSGYSPGEVPSLFGMCKSTYGYDARSAQFGS